MAPDSVRVPVVFLSNPTLPLRMALTEPDSREKLEVDVRIPELPDMAPYFKLTPAIVSLLEPIAKVPP